MRRKSINAIVGRSDQNLSSALDSLPDLHVRFTGMNTDYEYNLVSDQDNATVKKGLRKRSVPRTGGFEREVSVLSRKIDQFEVNSPFRSRRRDDWLFRPHDTAIWTSWEPFTMITLTIIVLSSIDKIQNRNSRRCITPPDFIIWMFVDFSSRLVKPMWTKRAKMEWLLCITWPVLNWKRTVK